jgi:hypothetical protein
MRALLMGLTMLAATAARAATPLALAERQVTTLEFARPVARLATTDPDLLLLEASGSRVRVTAVRAGRVQVDVVLDDGATATFDVVVEPNRRPAAAVAPAAPAGQLLLRVGEARRLPVPGLARVLAEDNGVVRVQADGAAVTVTGLVPGRSSVVLVDGAGVRTTVPIQVQP